MRLPEPRWTSVSGDFEFERLAFFSDAVFAIAITLLVLDIRVDAHLTSAGLTKALVGLLPALGAFALSFVVIGRFWILHHRLFGYLQRWDGRLVLYNLAFLATVIVIPFPTRLLADYGDRPVAAAVYAGSVMACSGALMLVWAHVAGKRRLLADEVSEDAVRLWYLRGFTLLGMFALAVPLVFVSPSIAEGIWWMTFPATAAVHRLRGSSVTSSPEPATTAPG